MPFITATDKIKFITSGLEQITFIDFLKSDPIT